MTYKFEKGPNGQAKSVKRGEAFARVNPRNSTLALSSAVRNFIFPNTHVRIDIDVGNECLVLTPTNDENAYAFYYGKGGSQICFARLSQHISFPIGERIPVRFICGQVIIPGKLVRNDL